MCERLPFEAIPLQRGPPLRQASPVGRSMHEQTAGKTLEWCVVIFVVQRLIPITLSATTCGMMSTGARIWHESTLMLKLTDSAENHNDRFT